MKLKRGDLVWIPAHIQIEYLNSAYVKKTFVRHAHTSGPSMGLFLREMSGTLGPAAVVFRHGQEIKINPNYIRKME